MLVQFINYDKNAGRLFSVNLNISYQHQLQNRLIMPGDQNKYPTLWQCSHKDEFPFL
jgi:hypothetical protein